MMPSDAKPLRNALREAVEEMLDLVADTTVAIDTNDGAVEAIAQRNAAMDRVAALIDQVPLVFEARETE